MADSAPSEHPEEAKLANCPTADLNNPRLEAAVDSYIHLRPKKAILGSPGSPVWACEATSVTIGADPPFRDNEAGQGAAKDSAWGQESRKVLEQVRQSDNHVRFQEGSPTTATAPSRASLASKASSRSSTPIQRLHSYAHVKEEQSLGSAANPETLEALEKATFRDARWQNALLHMQDSGHWGDSLAAQHLIRKGAKAFGLWHLPPEALIALMKHFQKEEAIVSPALEAWSQNLAKGDNKASKVLKSRQQVAMHQTSKAKTPAKRRKRCFEGEDRIVKIVLLVFVFLLSNLYALEVCMIMYPGVIGIFGWPIYLARAGGCGALLWTALLFFTMSRTVMRVMMRWVPINSRWAHAVADSHKEIHIFSGQMLLVTGIIHAFAHCIGTLPGFESHTKEEINAVIGCANRETTPGYVNVPMSRLAWPKCPLEKQYSFKEILFSSVPGISGICLLLVIGIVAWTGRQVVRTSHFDIFWYVHNAAIPLWLLLLFAHGSNGWVGVGFPLVVMVCGFPVALYLVDRIGRILRYYLFAGGKVKILDVVIRPGKNDVCKGALVHLSISRPPFLWSRHFRSGMYGFLCMPQYAPLQWHPFTICSGQDDETVQFIVAGLGDWTEELVRRCWTSYVEGGDLPKIGLDGPYLSPTTTALSREVLIAVGAGVGVTPLLSLMSTIIATLERNHREDGKRALPLKEAHFYWMTRSADELLFGRKHFTKIVSNPKLRDKVFLHLHVTHKAADRDVSAYLFREAVRLQSNVDREAFQQASRNLPAQELISGAQMPWCWLNGAKQDVLWVGSLVESTDGEQEQAIAKSHATHWAAGIADSSGHGGAGEEPGKRGHVWNNKARRTGLFSPQDSGSDVDRMQSTADCPAPSGLNAYMPVVLGRPDFAKEVRAIGQARPGHNVHVYICGNDAIVNSLQEVCDTCNEQAQIATDTDGELPQKYAVHYERFG